MKRKAGELAVSSGNGSKIRTKGLEKARSAVASMGGGGGGSDTAVVESCSCSCSCTASQANATELQDETIKARKN